MKRKPYFKYLTVTVLFLVFLISAPGQDGDQNVITVDIDNFWTAYDKIITTTDRDRQLKYINELYIDKGSPGLKAIMQARRYTDKSYIDAINDHPLFWNSVRANTLKAQLIAKEIESDVAKIKDLYPELKPAKIYFTIGVFRTGGTTMNGMVLIGSELAMADPATISTEFSKVNDNLKPYFATNPIANIVPLNTHEYIHTQQKTTIANSLLGQTLMEGVAEFVSIKATGRAHAVAEPFVYGKQNNDRVRGKFASQMFDEETGFWFYSNAPNEFKTRDLGYYVGYAICEKYYDQAADKKQAIREMIELDYNDTAALEKFVQKSGYFKEDLRNLKRQYSKNYQKRRPSVVGIKEFKNGSKNVNPNLIGLTIEFSTKMSENTDFNFGPLGKDHSILLKKPGSLSADKKSITLEIELKPNREYQLMIDQGFRDESLVRLKPYLLHFKTAAK